MAAKPFAITIAFGEEEFLLDRIVARCKATWIDRELREFDGATTKDYDFVNYCETSPLFGGNKGVILDNAHKMDGKRLAEYLKKHDPKDLSTTILVVCRSATLLNVWSKVKSDLLEYQKLKPWESDKAMERIVEEAKKLGLTLNKDVPSVIHRLLGDDLRSTVSELTKLSYLAQETNGQVSREQVLATFSASVAVKTFDVANAAFARNTKEAMRAVSILFQDMGEAAAVPITVSLMDQAEKMLVARHMLDEHKPAEEIAGRYGMSPFGFKKNILPVLLKHDVKRLRNYMQRLAKLDVEVKGPAQSKRTLVELAVLSITA